MDKDDRISIVRNFVERYILEDMKDKCFSELTEQPGRQWFARKLEHGWEGLFRMERLRKLTKEEDRKDTVNKLMNERGDAPCYLISCLGSIDGRIIGFMDALNCVYGMGCGALLYSIKSSGLFLETGQEQGRPNRFIGLKAVR
jgi:hypothetical protein